MTDSGSEGLGFESQRDHEGKREIEYESSLSIIRFPFLLCRMAGASLLGYAIPTGSHTNDKDFDENLFSVGVFIVWMSDLPVAGLGKDEVSPNGITFTPYCR